MPTFPTWLPPMLEVSPFNSETTYQMLYGFFCKTFNSSLSFREKKVWFYKDKDNETGKEKIFWHLVERKQPYDKNNRTWDPERAARMPWIKPILLYSDKNEVLVWNYLEGNGKVRTYCWLYDFDFIVIIEPNKDYEQYRLVTSFHIDGKRQRLYYEKKYNKREK